MEKKLYCGIDVSKDKLDISLALNDKEIITYAVFENSTAGCQKLFQWSKARAKKLKIKQLHFCLEATGIYHEELADYLQEQENVIVSIVNPSQTKAFSECIMLRTKNDKVDSKMIAFYAALKQPEQSAKPLEEIKKLRKLVRHLNYLVESRAHEKTRLTSLKDKELIQLTKETISFYDEQIKKMEEMIKEHVDKYPGLKQDIKLLKTIPGISDKTASEIISEIYCMDISVKSQIAHAGLAPRERKSGSSIRGKSTICKKGNKKLRKSLYMPSLCAIRKNPLIKLFYERLVSKGKPKKVALIASMRKLLSIAVSMLKNRQPFDITWAIKKQKELSLAI
jgi:transposase